MSLLRLFSGLSAADVPHPCLNDDQKFDWLRLIRTPNVGPVAFRFLINQYGGAKAALEALPDLAQKGGRKTSYKVATIEEIEEELYQAQRAKLSLLAMGEINYPPALVHIEQAPPLLYVKGNENILAKPAVAIVGSRNSSVVGQRIAHEMAQYFMKNDIITSSGLARGIDGAAHSGATTQDLSATIAVLAGGLNHIYPPQHLDLAQNIVDKGGALISEMAPNYKPRAKDFPRRNRIISGLSLGIVIIEAAIKSGSLITARMGMEHNRVIFAVPGSPLDPRSEGTNKLIRDGAILVRNGKDVLQDISPIIGQEMQSEFQFNSDDKDSEFLTSPLDEPTNQERKRLIDCLSVNPIEIDTLITYSEIDVSTVQMGLLELELAGKLERHPGGRVALLPD